MPKYFGTDGVRGIAGKFISTTLAYRIGRYIGQYPNGHKNKILIARDTRISGKLLANSVGTGAVASGSDVYDIGVSTTPSVSYLVRKHHFDFGVMISASHNPYYDNGIKVFNSQGEKLESSIEELIEGYIDSPEDNLPMMDYEHIGEYPDDAEQLVNEYISYLVSKASPLVAKLKVLVDCSNGSASKIAPRLLDELGCTVTITNASPDGININKDCGSTHIENLSKMASEGNYDVAFAFDGDADRCLAMTNEGKVVDGDAIMYICAKSMREHRELNDDTVVITVMSNLGLKKAFEAEGIKIHETTVGDKYVQADMKANNLSLGGEQSGHIIFLEDMNTGDCLLTMIKVMNILVKEKKSIQELVKPLVIYPQCLKNVKVKDKKAILSDEGFNKRIKELEDGLNGYGRILVRASGTEPLIRVMCEAKTEKDCEEICNTLVEYINKIQG